MGSGNSRGGGIPNPAAQSLLPRFLLYSSSAPSPVHLVPPWLIPGTFREPRAHSAGKRHTLREVRVSTWSSSICLPWHRPSRPGSGGSRGRPTIPLPWLPVSSHSSPLLAGKLEGWPLGHLQTSFQSHFALLLCSLLLLGGFLAASPCKIHTTGLPSATRASGACWGLHKTRGGEWGRAVLLLPQSPPFLWHRKR